MALLGRFREKFMTMARTGTDIVASRSLGAHASSLLTASL